MKTFLNWLDDRTGYREIVNDALYENVPGGARWRYVWGSTLVFAFVVQMITGFFLWVAYSPNAQGAWESVYYIQYEMQGGWLLRGVHHYMAQVMVVLLALHLMQVVIDGAYKAPREVNFWLGLILMKIILGLSLTGYLLPWDQKGFWATKVATNIMAITPVIGPELQRLVVGGADYGHHTLTRFFAIHAGLLPALLIGFLALHIYVFRRHGITAPSPEWGKDSTFWPDQVLKDAVACLAVLALVLFLCFMPAIFHGQPVGPKLGAELGAPADGTDPYSAARPEWYFLFLFQLLKYFPGESEVIGSHIIPGVVMLLLFLMPFVGRWKLGHRFNVGFILALLIGVMVLTGVAVREDQNYPPFVEAKAEAEHRAVRAIQLVEADRITTAGAVELVRNDPLLQGPKIFAQKCSGCHHYNGHDGTGRKVTQRVKQEEVVDGKTVVKEVEIEAEPSAADLGNFGTREWITAVLVDYKNHFAPLKNATFPGIDDVGEQFLDYGEMADWSDTHKEALTKESNRQSLDALVEFLVAQGERQDLVPVNSELVQKGREVYEFVELADGELSSTCIDCHELHLRGEEEPLGKGGHAPLLTGYGGKDWLKRFISNPKSFYGDKNAMPAFADQLTERELDLLVRWMTGDYHRPADAK